MGGRSPTTPPAIGGAHEGHPPKYPKEVAPDDDISAGRRSPDDDGKAGAMNAGKRAHRTNGA